MAPVVQANEADAERRAEIEAARNAVLAERLNPLHLEGLERSHAACTDARLAVRTSMPTRTSVPWI